LKKLSSPIRSSGSSVPPKVHLSLNELQIPTPTRDTVISIYENIKLHNETLKISKEFPSKVHDSSKKEIITTREDGAEDIFIVQTVNDPNSLAVKDLAARLQNDSKWAWERGLIQAITLDGNAAIIVIFKSRIVATPK